MIKQLNRIFAATLVAGVLAGCGAAEPVVTAPKSAFDSVRFQGNAPVGGASQAGNGMMMGQQGSAEGAQLLDGMRRTLANARGFDAEVRNYSQGHYKTGEKVSELRQSTTQARLIWMKPAKLRAEVIQTSNSLLVGAAMATTDGQNITARARGILGLIPIHLTASDKKMSTNRNWSFNDNNPSALLNRLTAPTAQWTVIGDGQVSGAPVKMIAVDGVRRLDGEITREVVMVEPQTMNLRGLAMYNATNTKVAEVSFLKFKWNPTVSASTFSL